MTAITEHPATVVELLDSPEKWTQGASAVNAEDKPVPPTSPEACRFCITGAIRLVYPDVRKQDAACEAVAKTLDIGRGHWHPSQFSVGITIWNDDLHRTYDEVIDVCKRAGI